LIKSDVFGIYVFSIGKNVSYIALGTEPFALGTPPFTGGADSVEKTLRERALES